MLLPKPKNGIRLSYIKSKNCKNSHFFGGLIVAIIISTTILGSSTFYKFHILNNLVSHNFSASSLAIVVEVLWVAFLIIFTQPLINFMIYLSLFNFKPFQHLLQK
jgi:hypothetical protein